jgi:hypothetical protein
MIENNRMINEQQIEKDLKGSGLGLIWGTILVFTWNEQRQFNYYLLNGAVCSSGYITLNDIVTCVSD